MYRSKIITASIAIVIASTTAAAQSAIDRAFTATGEKCEEITWSREALAQYPNIAEACREVMERDGKYYVKFSGTVRRVRGQEVTVNFKDGSDALTLTPPEDMSLYIDGRPRTVRSLRRGDELTFYVPQDKVVAPPSPALVGITVIPITRMRVAQVTPAESPQPAGAAADTSAEAPELPETASPLPLIGLSGLALTFLGIAPRFFRRRRGQSGFNP
jgi:hypothetical protein